MSCRTHELPDNRLFLAKVKVKHVVWQSWVAVVINLEGIFIIIVLFLV